MNNATFSRQNLRPCQPIESERCIPYDSYAMAYIPWQHMRKICDPCTALRSGTIFPELNKPFLGKGGCR